jgi:glycosyltransferase involved in cell wall biosynthesis
MKPTFSVVVPVYNESSSLNYFIERLTLVIQTLPEPFELIFVDDGSSDDSFAILERHSLRDERIRALSLSRNFGHQAALFAGIELSQGQAVISMDADLQHPPELIPQMIDRWRHGSEVVYTVKKTAKSFSLVRRLMMATAYSLIRYSTGLSISFGQSDFRLLDRVVVDALIKMPERRKFLRGLVIWTGFKQAGLEYEPASRYAGVSKYSYQKLFQLAFDGVFSFSVMPLRATLVIGCLAAVLGLAYSSLSLAVVVFKLPIRGFIPAPPGWLSTMMMVVFFGGVQLIFLGLVGEYLGRVYEEVQHRPIYIVRRDVGRGADHLGKHDSL